MIKLWASLNAKAPPKTSLQLQDLVALQSRARGIDWQRAFIGPHLFSGNRLSRLRGRGLDFEELKNYQQGDDIRHMDWKVSLRSGRPHVRVFNEEKEQRLQLLIDQRSSMWFGSSGDLKANCALKLAALLAWQAWGRGDRLGSCVFDGARQRPSRAARNAGQGLQQFKQWLLLHQRMCPGQVSPADSLLASLDWALGTGQRGQVIYLLSDLAGLLEAPAAAEQFKQRVNQLARHNQLRCLFIYDPLEQALPQLGQLPISDGAEHCALDTAKPQVRQDYAELLQQKINLLQQLAEQSANIGVLALHTLAPVWEQLAAMQYPIGDGRG
ncbi:MAG: DUF58 domain-containing protein [Cellvibrionaceae bacterium]|nr:DUF58 domain-containing protein [Cellvibrionaceae bacterium]MCV6628090.1 DUF58 domain-containing protein [Cellvibrionaceae bacterium]